MKIEVKRIIKNRQTGEEVGYNKAHTLEEIARMEFADEKK